MRRALDQGEPVAAAGGAPLVLSARVVLRWHAGMVAGLVLLHILLQGALLVSDRTVVLKLSELFDPNLERNVPTTFQAWTLWASAVLFLAVARSPAGKRQTRRWLVLALGFAYMGFDEIAQLHERGNGVVALLTGTEKGFIGWLLLFVPIALAALAYVAPLLRSVPPRVGLGLAAAAALYLGGAIGMELVSWVILDAAGERTATLLVSETIEETLEMSAIVLLVQVLLAYLRQQGAGLSLLLHD